ncbi:MAG: RNA polymerase factor sigma-70 [Pelotomaculum sp. PtaB.Bin013]|nr:MAG: RNA polymerase factor sigma-70 [Pelotomaculum sp. PtaB.Bin013]
MRKITEEDVITYYLYLVLQECKNSYKGLELEDRISEGMSALLQAVRTYNIRYGFFKDYAIAQIRRIMKQKNSKAWAEKKLDSLLSFDAPLANNAENESFTLAACIGEAPRDDSVLDVKRFINSLSVKEQQVIIMRMNGHSLQNISTALKTSIYSVNHILNNVRVKLVDYYGDNFCIARKHEKNLQGHGK